ncbi:MAG: cytochrome d ubiquinol oxidase subunit II [Muribaculaceae bacterium]|nr:cytochrome d ubiquinol oxidase subunit II [Muribaculaceae bacterium]
MLLEHLQIYWWLLISVLGALLVFLLFVQGGQTLLFTCRDELNRSMMINSLGRKWELTFTTLVVFGGAFFASFPLFYSTSFGGAYWLWMIILFSFIVQAVAYEFRSKKGNLYGTKTYDVFLLVNGCIGSILLGVSVAMFFFGAEFTVTKGNILDGESPVISQWVSTHGFEAIFNWKNLLLGFAVLFLARMQAGMYFMNNIAKDQKLFEKNKIQVLINGLIFVLFFLAFLAILLTSDGYEISANEDGFVDVITVPYKYALNYGTLWWALVALCVGTLMVLYAYYRSAFTRHFTKGIWWSGIGTILVVLSLFWVAGYNSTPYYPSLIDPSSSLSIANSSSSLFTLEVMSWVSILIPFVVAYIGYVWYKMNKTPITPDEMKGDDHKY